MNLTFIPYLWILKSLLAFLPKLVNMTPALWKSGTISCKNCKYVFIDNIVRTSYDSSMAIYLMKSWTRVHWKILNFNPIRKENQSLKAFKCYRKNPEQSDNLLNPSKINATSSISSFSLCKLMPKLNSQSTSSSHLCLPEAYEYKLHFFSLWGV